MTNRRSSTAPRRVYLALAVFSVALLGAMGHVMLLGARVGERYVPLVRASEEIKLSTTLAHLWLEEILSGDRQESMDEVRDQLRGARTRLRAMLEGHGEVVALEDRQLVEKVERAREKLSEFEEITEVRWNARGSAASGTRIDQTYDGLFREFIALAEEVEVEVYELIRRETRDARRTQWWVIAASVGLLLLVALLFARYSHQRRRVEEALHKKVLAEAEARKHLEELAHVVRLSNMTELVAGIAHEVNQPLAALSAASAACRRLVRSGRSGSPEHFSALELMESEASRASDIVTRLRAFVSKRGCDYELIDVNELVDHVVALGRMDSQMSRAEIRLALADGLPSIEADAVQIQQVLLNLLRNSLEATDESGDGEPVITIGTRLDALGDVEVSVADRGHGIPEDVSGRAFDPFFTTKSDGMGMGLSISHSIVTAHGGKIWIDTEAAEHGTIFKFTLPSAEEQRP